ncbi:MAG: hypothetical protein K0S71_549 [Clostridia bacterium]|jgi:hypothetical protein|nr:hypothetical protein [Clostridia bacterium]
MINELVWNVFEYSIYLIEMIFLYMFLNELIELKPNIPKHITYTGLIAASIIVFALSRIDKFSIVKIIIGYVLCVTIAVLFYEGRVIIKYFWATMYYVALAVIEIMLIYVSSYITQIDVGTVALTTNWYRIVFCVFAKLMNFILIKLIGQTTRKTFDGVPTKFLQSIIGVFIVSIISVLSIMKIGILLKGNELAGFLLVVIASSILILTIAIYQVFQYICDYFEKETQYEIIEYQNEMMIQATLERDRSHKEIRKIWHDFNNHISCIDMLLQMDNVKRARQYIYDMKINNEEVNFEIRTGNEIADAVINQKYMRAKKHGIHFDVDGFLGENIGINAVDLCALMSNGLDNAIEANLKIEDESTRKIQMHMKPLNEYLLIEIINTVKEEIKNINIFETSKNDKSRHGFGVLNMKKIVEKYEGHLQYSYEKNNFNLSIKLKMADELSS